MNTEILKKTLALIALLAVVFQPEGRVYWHQLKEGVHRVCYDKHVTVQGLEALSEEDMRAILPLRHSTLWWHLNFSQIDASLARHPLVKSSVVKRCSQPVFACFDIEVVEREPSFIVLLDEEGWVVGEEGTLLAEIPASVLRTLYDSIDEDAKSGEFIFRELLSRPLASLPVVVGLGYHGSSPRIVTSRLNFIDEVLKTVQSRTGLTVQLVRMQGESEFRAFFDELPFQVVFDFQDGSLSALRSQAGRLVHILHQNKGKEEGIEKIDLAYERLAVVAKRQGERVPEHS